MRLGGRFPIILLGATLTIIQPLVAAALKPDEIYPIAQQITVKIDGANTGSGVIIERQGNTYTVVTNRHVVQEAGSYTVQTYDGKSYQANQIKQFSNADLAVFKFTSSQNYSVAEKGNSDQITGGKTIYIGGYPAGITGISGRNFTFLPGQISGILSNPKDGYGFAYTVQAFEGMSGGPVLDEEGTLVGIHGREGSAFRGSGKAVLGIPLKTYLSLTGNISPTQPIVTTPTPQPVDTSSLPNIKLSAKQQQDIEKIRTKVRTQVKNVMTPQQIQQIEAAMKAGQNPRDAFSNVKFTAQQQQSLRQIMLSSQKEMEGVLTNEQKQQLQQYRQSQQPKK
jgi:Trypsin-like peptidase domain